MSELTHFNRDGQAWMVDVGQKVETERTAVAQGIIYVSPKVFQAIESGTSKKGDVLGIARIAGIMGAKKTSELIPLCHMVMMTKCTIEFLLQEEDCSIQTICTAKTYGKTGVEMEALTGVQIALLTIYDMCKALDKGMVMGQICLRYKEGGKSGIYER